MAHYIIAAFVGGVCYLGYRYYKTMAQIKKNLENQNNKNKRKKAGNLVYDKKTGQYVPENKKNKS